MQSLTVSRCLTVLLLGMAISACGFKLAGTAALPQSLSRIYLVTSNFDDRQIDALRGRLVRAGASISEQPETDAVRLSVSLTALPDRRLVTSASTGKTVERLTRKLAFGVYGSDGTELAPTKTLSQQRDIQLDDDNLLSSSQEKISVVRDLEQALFNQLILQLKRI